jgi:hypothetical protein
MSEIPLTLILTFTVGTMWLEPVYTFKSHTCKKLVN